MGGVIRLNRARNIIHNGERAEKLFAHGEGLWQRPVTSMLPHAPLNNSENILGIGSSILGCAFGATWSGGRHNYYNTFRAATVGNANTTQNFSFENNTQRGFGPVITYGNVNIYDITQNAKNGDYSGRNPFVNAGNFESAIIELHSKKTMYYDENSEYHRRWVSIADDYARSHANPLIYHPWVSSSWVSQTHIYNNDFIAIMELIRQLRADGVDKIYLSCNKPTLGWEGNWVANDDMDYYGKLFPSINDYYDYYQDRINYQIEREGLGSHVSMIPNHKVWERIYNDYYVTETTPPELIDYRRLWSTGDNGDSAEIAVTTNNDRHHYMCSYWGGYLLASLIAGVMYDIDVQSLPNTDGNLTIAPDLADYFKSVVADVISENSRTGRSTVPLSFRMPRINEGSLEDIVGSKLILDRVGDVETEETIPLGSNRVMGEVFYIFNAIPRAERVDNGVINHQFIGSRTMTVVIDDMSTNENVRFGLSGGNNIHSMMAYLDNNNRPILPEGEMVLYNFKAWSSHVIPHLNFDHRNFSVRLDLEYGPSLDSQYKVGTSVNTGEDHVINEDFTINSIVLRPLNNITFERVIVTEPLTEPERRDIFRWISKEYQKEVLEPLFPDVDNDYVDPEPEEPTEPDAPGILAFGSIGVDGATVSWSAPSANGSPITGYRLQFREEGGASTDRAGVTSPYLLDDLDPDTPYEVRVAAQNAIGWSEWSSWQSFRTSEVFIPQIRTASTNSTMSIHSGHSLTDTYINLGPFPNNMRAILESLGYTDMWDKAIQSTVPGSSIQYRFEHDGTMTEGHRAYSEIDGFHTLMITEGGPPPQTTSENMVNTLDYFCRFVANTIENGLGNEVILWSIWPSLYGPGASFENQTPSGDWAGYTFRTGLPEYENSFKYMADYATWKMHQLYPSLPEDWRVWLFPGHKWMERVYDDIQNDLVPGITDMQQLFGQPNNPTDDIHPSTIGSYGVSCLVATCMYQVNLTEEDDVWIMPEWTNHEGTHPAVSQALAEYFWQIAWEIATSYEPVGMGGTEGAALRWQPSDGDPMPNWTLANPVRGGGGDPEPGEMPDTVFLLNNDGSPYDGPTPSVALPALVDGAYTFTNQTVIDVPISRTTYICAAVWTDDPATLSGGGAMQVRLAGANEWTSPRLTLNINYTMAQMFWSVSSSVNWEHDRNIRVEYMPANPRWRVVELMLDGDNLSSLPSDDNSTSVDIMLDNASSGFEALDGLGRVAFPASTTDVRFAFVAYAQEIPDAGERAAMRAEAEAAIARVTE